MSLLIKKAQKTNIIFETSYKEMVMTTYAGRANPNDSAFALQGLLVRLLVRRESISNSEARVETNNTGRPCNQAQSANKKEKTARNI